MLKDIAEDLIFSTATVDGVIHIAILGIQDIVASLAKQSVLSLVIEEGIVVVAAAQIVIINAAIEKTLAMSVGMQLAFCYLSPGPTGSGDVDELIQELKPLLTAGV